VATLINQTKQSSLFSQVIVANDFKSRLIGLIGKKKLEAGQAMLFPGCNWIHTFFMKMPIDVIYLDKKMQVKRIQTHLKPWRLPAPVIGASTVIETMAGQLDHNQIDIGDTLYVGG
jgi:uncharacterized protein